jgi:hypothetical protein
VKWGNSIELLTNLALGAAGAFWFAHFVWGYPESAKAAHLMALIWVPGLLLKVRRNSELKNA